MHFTKKPSLHHCELVEVQISLHKIVHVDWLRFCALRNKMANERKGNAGRGQRASQAVREETDHPTAFSPLGGQLPIQEKKKKKAVREETAR